VQFAVAPLLLSIRIRSLVVRRVGAHYRQEPEPFTEKHIELVTNTALLRSKPIDMGGEVAIDEQRLAPQ
jgi:hypothetical protein